MVGYFPDNCPFCGSTNDKFITSQECSTRYRVVEKPVTDHVSVLNSTPKLGLEHATYRIRTKDKTYWIDCPSCFDRLLTPVDVIIFTHFHFLGASNQYREHFPSSVWIHDADSRFSLCRGFTFDQTFRTHFKESGIEAFHINGHTPGFTCYFFEGVFFMCDYTFYRSKRMIFNPYGPESETREGGYHIRELLEGRDIKKVCAVDYVMGFNVWLKDFERLLIQKG
jgi:hypothetical protein